MARVANTVKYWQKREAQMRSMACAARTGEERSRFEELSVLYAQLAEVDRRSSPTLKGRVCNSRETSSKHAGPKPDERPRYY
jgi:hypothetical protein